MSNAERVLLIYTREDCCLCHDMLEGLKNWQYRFNFKVKLIDIDQDSTLTERFAARIPLLAAGDVEICQYHLDEQALLSFFNNSD
jgi:Glutaredoxin-like domain (DUF836)